MNKTIKQINEEFENLSKLDKMNETILSSPLQALNEMSIAWNDTKANKCCWVENPTGHNNEYFKYLNSFSYRKANKVARISMLEPEYLIHRNSDGKENWRLTNKEKKELVHLMEQPSDDFPEISNWKLTITQYNLDNFGIKRKDTIDGTFDKKKFPDALSINLAMPDYTKL